MNKIIIENHSELPMDIVLVIVGKVMAEGRVSNNGKQYCYFTTFRGGEFDTGVATDLNKCSDKFTVADIAHKKKP